MKEIHETYYLTIDGTRFDDIHEAARYEFDLKEKTLEKTLAIFDKDLEPLHLVEIDAAYYIVCKSIEACETVSQACLYAGCLSPFDPDEYAIPKGNNVKIWYDDITFQWRTYEETYEQFKKVARALCGTLPSEVRKITMEY